MTEITDQLIKSAQHFIGQIVEFSKEDEGGILVDRVDIWRFRNKLATVLVAKTVIENHQVTIQRVSSDIFMTLLEEAGKKENPKINRMFASLLFGFLNPKTADFIHPSYIKVLGELSVKDVTILEALYGGIESGGYDYKTKCLDAEAAVRLFNFSLPSVLLSFQNIWRLGICSKPAEAGFLGDLHQIVFTDYGWNFLRACKLIK